jgi:immunity protein 5 of polymorphic toxin system
MNHRTSKQDQKTLAIWAAECAEHVLSYFEERYPEDNRPRKAIEACRTWARTGIFKMADVRGDSLASHAAAREAEEKSAAQFAARAAGQAVATAHVPSHAIGAAWYGVKAADSAGVAGEREWQYKHLPKHLRVFILRLSEERPALAKVLRYPTT